MIFGTFKGFRNNQDGTTDLKFNNLTNELGEITTGEFLTKQNIVSGIIVLKFGNRYLIKTNNVNNKTPFEITQIKKVNKNPKCGIFRRFKDEFHIISGKYQGRKDKDIPTMELSKYCIWLGHNTYNEATIKNTLALLKKIHI